MKHLCVVVSAAIGLLASDLAGAGQAHAQQLGSSGSGSTAAFTPDNSLPTLSSGKVSASGLNNVLSFAPGIPINDGNAHTIANAPTGTIFHGITTLAGLAALTINGAKPFFFLTDNGTITAPMCNYYAATYNCFTSSSGYYKLTDSMVPNMSITWLALQAALLTRSVYLPGALPTAGAETGYEVDRPLMMPLTQSSGQQTFKLVGDGVGTSVIQPTTDFGQLSDGFTDLAVLMAGDPAATSVNQLGRWVPGNGMVYGIIQDIGLWGNLGTSGSVTSTYRTDGITLAARLEVRDVDSSWFHHDAVILGDHTLYTRLSLNGGYTGLYWSPPNSILVGDEQFLDFGASGGIYGVEVDGATSMAGQYKGESYIHGLLFAIYGDTNGCNAIIGGADFDNLLTEYNGLGFVEDGHNWNGSTYNDSNKCRGVVDTNINRFDVSFDNGQVPSGTTMRRRATFDVTTVSGRIHGIGVNGMNPMPIADPSGAAGIAMFNINNVSDVASGLNLELEGAMANIFGYGVGAGVNGATIPVFSPSANGGPSIAGDEITWNTPGGDGGTFAVLATTGNYTTTKVGDLMEYQSGTFGIAEPSGNSNTITQPVMGAVAQAGLKNGMMMPLQTHGYSLLSAGYHYGTDGYETKSTGIGPVAFVAGSGGTAGSYNITATSGCGTEPTITVTVSGGAITSVTLPNNQTQYGCTGVPVFPTSSITGLSGGSLTALWPSAEIIAGTSAPSIPTVGYGLHYSTGNPSNGTQTSYSRLLGMQ